MAGIKSRKKYNVMVFSFDLEDEKCGECNWRVVRHHILAQNEGEARLYLRDYGGHGLCGDDMIRLIQELVKEGAMSITTSYL